MANNQPFFAIVEEQRCWLDDLVREQDVWCVATFLGDRPSIVLDRHALASLSFELGTGPALLNIGRTDLAPEPVWRMAERRRLVDMIRSRAIQYNPSLVRGDTILEGHLGIMRRLYYEELGLPYEPLQRWFASLVRSLKKTLHVEGAAILARAGTEPWVR
ncbi:MAG: hypothetical protein M3466_16000, partial [Gemmatimonadota bacterium]|nr:hypothetical protein [Gemmatimonadota bacterium]